MAKEPTEQWSIKDEILEMKTVLDRVDVAIRGNGKEGLVTRVVKLEQVAKLLIWIAVVLFVPVAGLVIKTVYEHF